MSKKYLDLDGLSDVVTEINSLLNDYMPKAGGTFSSGLVVGSTASSVLELPNQAAIKAKVTNGSNTLSTIIKAGGQVVEFGSPSYLTRLYSKGRPQLYDYSQSPTFSGSIATLSDIPAAVTSVNGLSGGSLTSPLVIKGGDATTAAKLALDQTASGQITNNGTQTLFGFTSNNATSLTVGHSSYALALRGSGTRPKFNGNDLAMASDSAPSIVYTTTAPSAANTSGLKVALLDSEPSTKYDGWIYLIKES